MSHNPYGGCIDIPFLIVGGHLHFEDLKIWFGHLSLSFKFEYDPVSGY